MIHVARQVGEKLRLVRVSNIEPGDTQVRPAAGLVFTVDAAERIIEAYDVREFKTEGGEYWYELEPHRPFP